VGNNAQDLGHPTATVPAWVCGDVLRDVIDLAIHGNPAIIAVLVLSNVRQTPGATQLAQLQQQQQQQQGSVLMLEG